MYTKTISRVMLVGSLVACTLLSTTPTEKADAYTQPVAESTNFTYSDTQVTTINALDNLDTHEYMKESDIDLGSIFTDAQTSVGISTEEIAVETVQERKDRKQAEKEAEEAAKRAEEAEKAKANQPVAPVDTGSSSGDNQTPQNFQGGTADGVALQYSAPYNVSDNPLTPSKGVVNFNGHKETYYSQRVLPGTGLNIPGRHVADDGTVRDGDGYIVVASDLSYLSRGSVILTSLGPAKVYDTGCAYGTIDIYVNW